MTGVIMLWWPLRSFSSTNCSICTYVHTQHKYVYILWPVACNVGEYKRLQGDDECIVCPENSNSTGVGTLSCDCLDGYYRAENEGVDTDCTSECIMAVIEHTGSICL